LLTACGGESDGGADAGDGAGAALTASAAPTESFASQASAGAQTYGSNCAACHGANLEGSALGPILSG
jgi:mono/diheme cytochrome c family protein